MHEPLLVGPFTGQRAGDHKRTRSTVCQGRGITAEDDDIEVLESGDPREGVADDRAAVLALEHQWVVDLLLRLEVHPDSWIADFAAERPSDLDLLNRRTAGGSGEVTHPGKLPPSFR